MIAILVSLFIVTIIYSSNKFVWKSNKVESINIYTKTYYKGIRPIVYIIDKSDVDFNFSKPYKHQIDKDGSFKFDFGETKELRKFRLYFDQAIDSCLYIEKILFNKESTQDLALLKELQLNDVVNILEVKTDNKILGIKTNKGYLESSKNYLYSSDITSILVAFCSMILILGLLYYIFKRFYLADFSFKIRELSVIVFISSIFLPHPIFNVALIFSALLMIKHFNLREFISNKINLIFIGLFLVLLFNDLFISASGFHNLKATEKNLPLLILPVYISCIRGVKVLKYFPISAIFIGVGLFLTSMIDTIIFKNINYFSFEEFTKYIHPVYFSYLLSFSIFYIFLNPKIETKYKNIVQAILFFFLILAGSKMIITLTLIIYMALFVRNKKSIVIVLFGVILLALFPPIQNRFKEVVNLNDLSIVKEDIITDTNDHKINGLTLRVLIWQETIKTVNTLPKFLFGLGVDDASNEALKVNLENRGLGKYKRYSTHNQFINLYMRTGVVGLIILLLLIGSVFYAALRKKNKMLLIMIVMFTFAMLTESVFQRVLGIYFFTTVLLFLMKPIFLNENSNNWN
ncbi:MAG: O-antigen ligase family protein [Flavobacteriales bacterium]|nr:O-antigen ligase family protein [Flavobacteriales bacterium]